VKSSTTSVTPSWELLEHLSLVALALGCDHQLPVVGEYPERALDPPWRALSSSGLDGRVTVKVAALAKAPTGGQGRREGQMLSLSELEALATACNGPYSDLIMVLGLEVCAGARSPDSRWVTGFQFPARVCGCRELCCAATAAVVFTSTH